MQIFLYEMVSAGHLPAAAALRDEGTAMLAALMEDFARIPGVRVVTPRGSATTAKKTWYDEVMRDARGADAALLVAPEFDDLLGRCSEVALEAGCTLLGSTPAAIRAA